MVAWYVWWFIAKELPRTYERVKSLEMFKFHLIARRTERASQNYSDVAEFQSKPSDQSEETVKLKNFHIP